MKLKKLVSFVLVFVLVLTCTVALSGCDFKKTELQIDSYRLEKVGEDDIIIIKFNFKNNTGYETCLDDEYDVKLYQTDVSLDGYYGDCGIGYEEWKKYPESPDFEFNEESSCKYIRDGGEYNPELAFYLEDTETDIEVIMETYRGFGKKTTKIINLE